MSNSHYEDIAAMAAQHQDFLQGLARALVTDVNDAEELVQETWTALLMGKRPTLDRPRALLSTILRRKAISRARRESVRPAGRLESSGDGLEAEGLGPMETAAQLERDQMLLSAMGSLREPYRTAIYLRYREGLGAAAIAARTGAPVKTVRTHLHRGLAELRLRLDELSGERGAWIAPIAALAYPGGMPAATLISAGAKGATTVFTMNNLLSAIVALSLACIGTWWYTQMGDTESGPVDAVMEFTAMGGAESAGGRGARASGPPAPSTSERTAPAAAMASAASPPTGAAMQGETVTFRVQHPDGSPAAGRSVILEEFCRRGEPAISRVLVTDAAGLAAFAGVESPAVYKAMDSQSDGSMTVRLTEGGDRQFDLRLRAQIEIVGSVLDAEGEPVAGAGIWCTNISGREMISVRHATSDVDGAFSLTCTKAIRLHAALPGMVPSAVQRADELEKLEAGRFRGTFALQGSGALLSGIVRNAAGEPVPSVFVAAGPRGQFPLPDREGKSSFPLRVSTDAGGRFEYPSALPDGTWPLFVYAKGFAPSISQIVVSGGHVAEQSIELSRGATVSGRVLLANGEPVRGAIVKWLVPEASHSASLRAPLHLATSTEDGVYELRNVPLGAGLLQAKTPQTVSLERASQPVDVAGTGDQVVEVQLSDAPLIAGQVLGQDGEPMVGYLVGVKRDWLHRQESLTDAQGRFRLTSLQEGMRPLGHWDLQVRSAEGTTGEVIGKANRVQPGDESVVIQAVRPLPVTARLVGSFELPGGVDPPTLSAFVWQGGDDRGRSMTVDQATGQFRYGPVTSGTATIFGLLGDEEIYQKSGIVLTAGETVDVGMLRIDARGEVRVTLDFQAPALPEGAAMEEFERILGGVGVVLYTDDGGYTDQDGKVRLRKAGDVWVPSEPVEARTWIVGLDDDQVILTRPQTVEIVAGETAQTTLRAEMGRRTRVKLELPAAASWSSLTVKCLWPDGVLASESKTILREDLRNPTMTVVRLLAPVGSAGLVVETDTHIGHEETIEVPNFLDRFRGVTLTVD